MTLAIFPSSPVWANIDRTFGWAEEVFFYDSGVRQASTAWTRPLFGYNIPANNYNEIKQNSLEAFVNSIQGMVSPFLFKDPYDFNALNVTQPTSTNMNSGDGFFFIDARSYRFIPDSAALAVTDPRSGALFAGSHFVLSQDNGFCAVQVPVSSVWVASFEFFRKVAFNSPFRQSSPVFNIFNSNIVLQELLPDR